MCPGSAHKTRSQLPGLPFHASARPAPPEAAAQTARQKMSSAQRLAMQRLARSQDRQEQRQVSSQTTSSSSYGAWFTPGVDKPIRRPLTSPSKQIAAQQEQLQRCRLSGGSSGSSTPAAPAAASASAHGGLSDPASTQQAGRAAARPAAESRPGGRA